MNRTALDFFGSRPSKHRPEQEVVANRTITNRGTNFMLRQQLWFFFAMAMLAASAPLHALNYEVGGCKTGAGWVNFTTISAAVIGVPAGSKVQVCPGTYPEQVTITQPLTLQGIASGNANRAVITIPASGSLAPNVTSIIFGPTYAQVLVEDVSPAGAVNITGITVDGAGVNGCSGSTSFSLAGIVYASGTTGTVNEVTARNQVNSGCGVGISAENGSGTNETIAIENSSVHNIGGFGISAATVPSSTLTATITGNFLSNSGSTNSILGEAVNGQISDNVVTSNTGFVLSIFADGGVTISGNTLADVPEGIGTDGAITVSSNKLSNVGSAIVQEGSSPIKSNTIKNTVCAIDFYETSTSGTISGNNINDAQYGFGNWSGSTITGNSLYNIDTIQAASSPCP